MKGVTFEELYDAVSEMHKELHGVRCRRAFSSMEDLESWYNYLHRELQEREEEHLAPEELLYQLGIDQATYERWMEDVSYA